MLRRGNVSATLGAHLPTPPSMLPVTPAQLPRNRSLKLRQKSDLASSSPVVSLAWSLVTEQAFNDRPDRIFYVGWEYVSEQMLCARRRTESEQQPHALEIGELHDLSLTAVIGLGLNHFGVAYGHEESDEATLLEGQVAVQNVRA